MANDHILVIDDDTDVLGVMQLLLSKNDYRVSTAPSAKDALVFLRQDRPDLILLDVMMPGMNGLELLNALKLQPEFQKIPVILHSSVGEEDVVVKGLELGADDYITKQTSPKIKVSRIRTALRRLNEDELAEPVGKSISLHEVELFPDSGRLLVNGTESKLDQTASRVATLLLSQPGVLHTKDSIIQFVRKEFPKITRTEVETATSLFMQRLGRADRHVEKILGVGLRMKEPELN